MTQSDTVAAPVLLEFAMVPYYSEGRIGRREQQIVQISPARCEYATYAPCRQDNRPG